MIAMLLLLSVSFADALSDAKDEAIFQIDAEYTNRRALGFEISTGVFCPVLDPDFWVIASAAAAAFDYSGGGVPVQTVGNVEYRVASSGAMNTAAGLARDRWVVLYRTQADAQADVRAALDVAAVEYALDAYLALE